MSIASLRNVKMISFILPSRNNLPYVKSAIASIRKFYLDAEIVLLDDNSTDGTDRWVAEIYDPHLTYYKNESRQVGHTVLYDIGIKMCKHDIFSIFHADMICGPNYIENLLKHLKPGGVVSATRIEPPLHPPGKEKIVMDFGMYPEDLKIPEFIAYCRQAQQELINKDITTKGIFAPWAMYKDDFIKIGGHDKFFSPFPYEDSDIFQRFILAGYDIIQSRDAFVYHLTCRGHRWTEKVQQDDHFYKLCCAKNTTHFIRKWGSWIENDEFSYPVIKPLYDVGFVVNNCSLQILGTLEPWCSTISCDCPEWETYINQVQPVTPFDLRKRVLYRSTEIKNDIIIQFDASQFTQERFQFLTQLQKILSDSGELGEMQFDIFKFFIRRMPRLESLLVHNNNELYQSKLVSIPSTDEFYTDELFRTYSNTK